MQPTDDTMNIHEDSSNPVAEISPSLSSDIDIKTRTLRPSPSYLLRREESTSEDASSVYSETSAIESEQEPFDIFQHKATKLMLDLFFGYRTEDVKVKRMQGGKHNRIIGVTLCKSPPKHPWYSLQHIRNTIQPCLTGRMNREIQPTSKNFILRIPRSPTQDMHHQVTTLAYLAHRISYPVPTVVVFDASEENALGKAYMLQERLSGRSLINLWKDLNQTQRLSAVRQISNILLDLRKVKSRSPGILSIRNTTYDLKRDLVSIEPIPIPRSRHTRTRDINPTINAPLSEPQTTKSFLLGLISRQRAREAAANANLPACDALWTKIIKMIHKLHDLALIPDSDPFYFYHGDLHPRNILAVPASESSVEITGILGWDLALFAPMFMSTRAPLFLWGGDEEGGAQKGPGYEGLLEAKRVFESVVGGEFLKSAYCVELVLISRLWLVLLRGFTSGEDFWMAEEVLEEFGKLHRL